MLLISCKENSGDSKDSGSRDGPKVELSRNLETSRTSNAGRGVPDRKLVEPRIIREDSDLNELIGKYSSAEITRLLKDALEGADDRVAFAQSLIQNYSGYPKRRIGIALSDAMGAWPVDYLNAVLSEFPVVDHSRLVKRQLSKQEGNRNGLLEMYRSMEIGTLRSEVASRMIRLDYEKHGIDRALEKVSLLDFQTERSASLTALLGNMPSMAHVPTATDLEKIRKFSEEWEDFENINLFIDYVKRSRKGVSK